MAVVLLLALLMALLDETIVNVGVKTLTGQFHAPLGTIQWVTGGYLLAVAVAIPFSGWAVDRFGGKTMWLVAVSIFGLGSLLSGLSWSAGSLIGFRVLQGLGGGMIVPIVQGLLARAAGQARMAKAMSLISIPLVVGPVLGPLLGGLFVDSDNWRWMFLLNVPLGVLALLLAQRSLPADQPQRGGERLDVLGLLLLSPGFAALVFACTTASQQQRFGGAKVLVSLVIGVLLVLGYVAHALRDSAPLIDVRLFANRGFALAVLAMLLVGATANTLLFLTPLYYQQGRGFSALHTGALLTPSGLLGALGSALIGKVAAKYTARATAPVGMLLAALGMAAFARIGPDTSQTWLAVALGVAGFGIGFTIPGTMAFMYRAVGPQDAARATSALFIFNQIGGSLGIAVVAVTIQHRLTGEPSWSAFGGTYWLIVGFALLAAVAGSLLPGRARFAAEPAA
jgi:EmrB/QacA subfamily drug resistance transporter